MKEVSQKFKDGIKKYGRQIDVMITYTENGIDKILDTDTLFSITPITNGNLLKSVMKQLNFESSIKVPKDTWVSFRFGIIIEEGITVEDVHNMRVDRLNNVEVRMLQGFEYIDFGKYLVAEEPEYNADTNSYTHKCFDKMIYAMKPYENINVTYPTTIKNYLNTLANKIGIRLEPTSFENENQTIESELYEGLEYTYRDVLDEIAQATGSIICINNKNKLEVKYLNETNETINEDSLKDIDVNFQNEKYGKINSVVLSRSAGSDNVYLRDEESVLADGLCEVKITDNQILNSNNRSDYLQGILNAVNGIEYYVNDFKSTGICYLELGDKYNIQIGQKTFNCVLLNDEIDITQGLEEQIHTDMPEQSETDYTKADKTDRKINQTNLIVDKQNQIITATVSRLDENEENISNLQVDVDGIHTEVRKKVGEDEIISKINQSAEAVTINANKIELSANDVLNLLSGNTINLTSKNIQISSNNFSVDTSGNMTCANANITGGNFNVSATSTNTDTLRITNKNDTNEYMYASPGAIQLRTSQGRSFMTVRSGSSDHSYLVLENGDTSITITEEGIICQNIYDNITTSNIPNMQIGSNGQIRRSTNTSTRKHKTEIKNLTDKELNPERLYDLEIKQFKYKKEYQPSEKDNRYNKTLVGFIAEDVEKIYPIATDYDENKEIENWNERYIIPPMLKLIQDHHKQIQKMQEEIEELKKEVNRCQKQQD